MKFSFNLYDNKLCLECYLNPNHFNSQVTVLRMTMFIAIIVITIFHPTPLPVSLILMSLYVHSSFPHSHQGHSFKKDIALLITILIATAVCWIAYTQNQSSQKQMNKVMKDMQSLQNMEENLTNLNQRSEVNSRHQC